MHDEIPPHKDFPPPDLLDKLVGLYFQYMNCYMPLLHRPTFEQAIKEGLHLHDEGFGSTVLLVCANGARFTDDPRVLLEGYDTTQSSGWKWFQQVQMVRKSLLAPPRLYDLQIYAVRQLRPRRGANTPSRLFFPVPCPARPVIRRRTAHGEFPARNVCATSVLDYHRNWYTHGPGCRRPSEEGVQHDADDGGGTVAACLLVMLGFFWRAQISDSQSMHADRTLVAMDRHASFALGRPCAIQDEE